MSAVRSWPALLLLVAAACSRSAPASAPAPAASTPAPGAGMMADSTMEAQLALEAVTRFFDGMRTRDTALMRRHVTATATFVSVGAQGPGRPSPVDSVLAAVARATGDAWDERLVAPIVRVSGPFASVWTRYTFTLGTQRAHCGVDAVHLLRTDGAWRIAFMADTRRTTGCPDATPQDGATAARAAAQSMIDALVARDTAGITRTTTPGFRYFAIAAESGRWGWTEGAAMRASLARGTDTLDERLAPGTVQVDGPLAEVLTPYRFYTNGVFSHCGADSFFLARQGDGWRVFHLGYSTTRAGCGPEPGVR